MAVRKNNPDVPNARQNDKASSGGKTALADLPAKRPDSALARKPVEPKALAQTAKRPASAKKGGGKTRIQIHYDAGFGNSLYIRGEGAGLSWHKGHPLRNEKSDLWSWETELPFETLEFKVLLNDQYYETGVNHRLSAGDQHQHRPSFE